MAGDEQVKAEDPHYCPCDGCYVCSASDEEWNGSSEFGDREEAISEAAEDLEHLGLEKGDRFYTFRIEYADPRKALRGVFRARSVLEDIGERLYEEVGDWTDDYVEKAEKKDTAALEEKLLEAFMTWAKEQGVEIHYYTLEDQQEHEYPGPPEEKP